MGAEQADETGVGNEIKGAPDPLGRFGAEQANLVAEKTLGGIDQLQRGPLLPDRLDDADLPGCRGSG